jgi:hypothetical protein
VGEDAEAERGIFVEDLALGHVVAEMAGDERAVLQHILDDAADLLTAGRPRITLEKTMTLRGELLEGQAHGRNLRRSCYQNGAPRWRRARQAAPLGSFRGC